LFFKKDFPSLRLFEFYLGNVKDLADVIKGEKVFYEQLLAWLVKISFVDFQ
jgi:hypothetical protein